MRSRALIEKFTYLWYEKRAALVISHAVHDFWFSMFVIAAAQAAATEIVTC
jgi:hypothetical protein